MNRRLHGLMAAKVSTGAAADHVFVAAAALAPNCFKPGRLETPIDCCAEIAGAAPALPFHQYDIHHKNEI